MRMYVGLLISVLAFTACQSVPEKTAQEKAPRERCDNVQTGSRIAQCNRGDVRVISRDEIERDGHTHRGTPLPAGTGL